MEGLTYWAPVFGAGGLLLALITYYSVAAKPAGSDLMKEIAEMIRAIQASTPDLRPP